MQYIIWHYRRCCCIATHAMALQLHPAHHPNKDFIRQLFRPLIVGLFGGSRIQIAGPTGAFVVILANITAHYGISGYNLPLYGWRHFGRHGIIKTRQCHQIHSGSRNCWIHQWYWCHYFCWRVEKDFLVYHSSKR